MIFFLLLNFVFPLNTCFCVLRIKGLDLGILVSVFTIGSLVIISAVLLELLGNYHGFRKFNTKNFSILES